MSAGRKTVQDGTQKIAGDLSNGGDSGITTGQIDDGVRGPGADGDVQQANHWLDPTVDEPDAKVNCTDQHGAAAQ